MLPRKKGRMATPKPRETLKPFRDFLAQGDYSYPADSSVKPVFIDDQKVSVRYNFTIISSS